MSAFASRAVRLLAELVELDHHARNRKLSLTHVQRERRRAICRELSQWALSQQKGPPGAPNRQFPRASLRLKVQLIDGTRAVESESRSLSVGGLSVTAPIAPEVGQTMVLRLQPVAPDPPVMVTGVVVWYDRDRQMVGLRFSDLTDEARALLERLVFTNLLDSG